MEGKRSEIQMKVYHKHLFTEQSAVYEDIVYYLDTMVENQDII